MPYQAYVEVEANGYDDDFCLLFDGRRLGEGDTSPAVCGRTEIEALTRLLQRLTATDYHQKIEPGAPLPEGYRHARSVRRMLADMLEVCDRGSLPRDLYWGGNWDVRFIVKEG
jgi:hypothetical protein